MAEIPPWDGREIASWDDVVDFMNETCGICGCFLNNWPECEEGCIHTSNLDLCPRFRARERLPGDVRA